MGAKIAGIEVEAVEYNQGSATVRTQFDPKKTPPSMAVVATLADVMGVDPAELDPLYSAIDPDALDQFVHVHNRTRGDIHVTFTHENHSITVHSYGVITITSEGNLPTASYEIETER